MGFTFFKRKSIFTKEEELKITSAIKTAETTTSGEIRVFIENNCPTEDALIRAKQLFFKLKMDKTEARNGVLLYTAFKNRRLAVYGDEGINKAVGEEYWKRIVEKMLDEFSKENFVDGITKCILDIGTALQHHFPYDKKTDINELPDDIIFG